MGDIHDVVIIGSGPAGYTAALYAARANLAPLVLAGEPSPEMSPGGQLMLTTDVENFPGFPEGILGPDLMERFEKQAARFGAEIVKSNVTEVDFSGRPFRIQAGDREERAKSVILSTGARPKRMGLESETALFGKGVTSCATCDGAFHRGKPVAVVGGGDSAMEEALFLTRFASKVTVIHRRDELRASKIMADRAREHEKIDFLWNSEVTEVLDPKAGKVTGLKIRNTESGDESELSVTGMFLAIGHIPNTELFDGVIGLDDLGYILLEKHTMTNVEGVFAAGDCVDHRYRQAITAAGMGCRAAIDAERWLEASD